ncbi:hypothetical protein F2Q69_00013584 [Brassica cretica]|uniref:Uncharacterized protein n=1 Tax=Brassica cretica TaxID=69181 RepID=A0A8S9R9Q1_BRACR|nr:hypothetical protein F2Q69_00013584 [Brassica cretica]
MEPWIVRPVVRKNGQATPNSPNGESDQSIQLAVGRVGCTKSNSPNSELDQQNPTHHWASWMFRLQLAQWRVGSVLSKSAFSELYQSRTMHSHV